MKIDVSGIRENRKMLKEAISIVKGLSPAGKKIWERIGQETVKRIVDRTKRGLDVDGQPFKPYSSNYKKKGRSIKVNLKVSGELLKSIKEDPDRDHVRIYVDFTMHSKAGITNYDLAVVHDQGGRAGRGKGFSMPKREFMGLTGKQKDQVKNIFKKLLIEKINQLGR